MQPIKQGGVVVATTKNHAIKRHLAANTLASARRNELLSKPTDANPAFAIDVPRWSKLEVDHVLSNYELIGIGRLRFDRGDTVLNEQEVDNLRRLSGSVPQALLDECIV